MSTQGIVLDQVHLHYAAVAYQERSIKSLLTRALSLKKK